MKLSQLFTGQPKTENHVEENGRGAQSYARTAEMNRQIRSLVPGQTIHGEIVARNGSEVQIRLSDDMVMNARVDQSIHLELGKNVTFEVKSNGGTLSLSPLFTNIAADANVLKALDMAGLPVNDISVGMTEQLMKAGLPVNRNTLQQVYREINSFQETGGSPAGTVEDVVNLHKLQMPVNETNMRQMASYRNLTHQLIKGMTSVLDALPEAVNGMLAEGNEKGAAGLYRELFAMIREGLGTASDMAGETVLQETGEAAENGAGTPQELPGNGAAASGESIEATENGPDVAQELLSHLQEGPEAPGSGASGPQGTSGMQEEASAGTGVLHSLSGEARAALADNMLRAMNELQLSPDEQEAFRETAGRFARGELTEGDFFGAAAKLLEAAEHKEGGISQLHRLFGGKAFQNILLSQLKQMWTLRPEEVSRPEKVEELYRRIDRQVKGLLQALEAGGQEKGAAYRAASNLSSNVDFMNQLNQMYAYVQLPLHMRGSDAHGDLYVYTNKKSLAHNDGRVSALLHLDMEHLGPVDVYVTLQEAKVSTKFYVADEEILDFIEKHLDILTKRLEKRGYSLSTSTSVRGKDEEREEGGLSPLLQQEKGIMLSQYAFDVRT